MSGIGRFTGCDLGGIMPLFTPWKENCGLAQPVFSREAALLSFELASSAYDMNLDAWREAGWRDFSFQVDNTLLTGQAVNAASGGRLSTVVSDYFHFLARARLKRINPISQLRGALRQREGSDTCKAVVMLHPLSENVQRYAVAIGFMGTGKRIYDWFSNFRLNREEGMHAGFLQLTKEFEKNADEICFPETAKELGLSKLTLSDILSECRRPDSRFRVWMAGHSQGGAVMQLFAYREVRRGFLRQNMIGYGFASPSAVYARMDCDAGAFPLLHILNADDIFPRMGAALHIGRCRVLCPDQAMRKACYQAAWQDELFRAVHRLMRSVTDSAGAFLLVGAMLRALEDVPVDSAMAALNVLAGSLMPEKLLGALGSRREDIVDALYRRVVQGYRTASEGGDPPEETLGVLRGRIAALILRHGGAPFAKTALSCLGVSHKLRGEIPRQGIAPYQYIVTERFFDLRQRLWQAPVSAMGVPDGRGPRRIAGGRFARLSETKKRRAR
ncbi:MAG: hypothetical protein IJQ33_04955 [Clostridia bacterium]|nr:hypothetical protein [Clostridia bacterium]MBR0218532.1 hypothetical protein [Clostridia bacterium]